MTVRRYHPKRLKGIAVKVSPDHQQETAYSIQTQCKKCGGRGRYLLDPDEGAGDWRNTAACSECKGHGFVLNPKPGTCDHEWIESRTAGNPRRGLHVYYCRLCGEPKTIDSSG